MAHRDMAESIEHAFMSNHSICPSNELARLV
jgi:hypothetical protein